MLASQQNNVLQPVQTWLTNVQTSLLSDTDYAVSILEHANTLLKTQSDVHEGANEGQPVIELQVESRLDRGIRRKDRPNEDSLFTTQGILHSSSVPPQPFALFMVADGMGGHANGQEASELAIESLVEYLSSSLFSKQITPGTFPSLLIESVQYTNQQVYQRNQEHHTNMGTTITAALVSNATAYVVNVGDSRTYLYRKASGLSQITRDHSLVAALVEAGVIQPADIYTPSGRNQIYRYLGEKPEVEVDPFVVPLADDDTLLLCSDGLWEMVRDAQIAGILTHVPSDPSTMANMLVQAALVGGGADNVSVIVVRVRKTPGEGRT
jgi:serine/threonine protein phosphatase PrpC